MAFRHQTPTTRFGGSTPSLRLATSERVSEADHRALRRLKMARLAANTEGSLRAKRQAIVAAMNAELIPWGPTPSRETVRQLEARWNGGQQSVEHYYEQPRVGRPKTFMASALEKELDRLLGQPERKSVSSLLAELEQKAEELDVDAPTVHLVRRAITQAGRLRRSAGGHGSRAAEVDALPQGRVPARHTHDVWALDELTLPVYHRQWDRKRRRWRSVRADVVLIVDVRSGAIVSYYIADPSRRFDKDGEQALSGFDSVDVLAALLSAACPELAPDATRQFAGYLPRRLRWDNAGSHKELAQWIDGDTTLSVDVRRIVKRRAKSNGAVERRVDIMKEWCAGIHGHVDAWQPNDQVWSDNAADQGAARSKAAGSTSHRLPRREPIEPKDLLSYDELCAAFDRVVRRYNYEHVTRMRNAHHIDLYHENLPTRRPRDGQDLVRALEPHTTRVQREGIVHYAWSMAFAFSSHVDGMVLLPDRDVTYYVDPLMRGAFARIENRLYFTKLADVLAQETKAGAVARTQADLARVASDRAAKSREEQFRADRGDEAVEDAKAGYANAQERYRAKKAGAGRLPKRFTPRNQPPAPAHDFPTKPAPDATPPTPDITAPKPEATVPSPWASPAPGAVAGADATTDGAPPRPVAATPRPAERDIASPWRPRRRAPAPPPPVDAPGAASAAPIAADAAPTTPNAPARGESQGVPDS